MGARLVEVLTDQLSAVQAASQQLRRQIDALRRRASEARSKLATLTARKQAADARRKAAMSLGGAAAHTC